jgi:hypothetical protein
MLRFVEFTVPMILSFSERRLKLSDRGQAAFQVVGERLGDLILGYADRLAHIAQGIRDNHPIFALAQNQADAGLVLRVAQQVVRRRKVEVHLAGILGLELANLEIDHNIAAQLEMVEQHVQVVVLVGHFEVILAADEGKPDPQLKQEGADVLDQAALDVALLGLLAKAKEVEGMR